MITLRQGKPKTILENSRISAFAAVETYNKPNNSFKIENYIILMIIAWTKLFHAFFQATIGEKYFYKEKNGRYKVVDGEKKSWELKECIKNYRKNSPPVQISEAVVANLNFFIGLRNKIEHRFWNSFEFDILLFGECQSLLFNYESLLINLFGEDYSINTCLAYALQFSQMRAKEQFVSQKMLLSKDMQDIKRYIDKYKTDLPQEIYDSQEYSVKLLQIPKVSNTSRSELAIEFVNWKSIDESDRENYAKITTIIKDKLVPQSVLNANLLKPSGVTAAVKEKTGIDIKIHNHTLLWKAFNIRPNNNSKTKFETIEKYCIYDEPHDDFLFTEEWVNFICHLLTDYGFTLENIRKRCCGTLRIDDYTTK